MRMRILSSVTALASTLLLALSLHSPLAQVPPAAPIEARVIVKYRADSALMRTSGPSFTDQRSKQAETLGKRIGVALLAGRSVSERSHVVISNGGLSSVQLAARIAAESDIEYAVVDERKRIVAAPNDEFYFTRPQGASSGGPVVGQWYLRPPGAALPGPVPGGTAPASINAEQAWDIPTGSASIVVAVLDTGLRFDHADLLGGNVLAGYDMVGSDAISGDGIDGRDSDASDPGDFVTDADAAAIGGDCKASPRSSWHGTKTLGLIGATTNNGVGIASVGRNVRVMPVRVLGKCGGNDSDVLAGMRWAAGLSVDGVPANLNKARVLNLSLGGTGDCNKAYRDVVNEITAAGVVIVAAAGNTAGRVVGTPANCPGVVAVAGLRHVGNKVGFSDLGPEIAISAPGGNCVTVTAGTPCQYPIMTTANAGTTTPVGGPSGSVYTDSFNASFGTSFSSPLVAGAAALMLSTQPALTPSEVKAALQATARPFPQTGGTAGIPVCTAPGSTDQLECYCPVPGASTPSLCGAGMLDVHAAVLAVAGVQARISVDTAAPVAGQPVTFSSTSLLATGRTLVSYEWAVVNGGGIVTAFSSATNAASATIVPTAAGTFSVSLTVVDDLGLVSTATASVTVAAVAAPGASPAPAAASADGGGGGGGALGVGWLMLLFSAVLALSATRFHEARCERARASARLCRPVAGDE